MNSVDIKKEQTMSSREIAELMDKRHDNVMRDIRSMLDEMYSESGRLNFEGTYVDAQNKTRECFNLDRYHTEILITGYDVKRRAAVIKRWYELESGQATPAYENLELRKHHEAMLSEIEQADKIFRLSDSIKMEQKVDMVLASAKYPDAVKMFGILKSPSKPTPEGPSKVIKSSLPKPSTLKLHATGKLLKKFNVGISAFTLNRLLKANGILDEVLVCDRKVLKITGEGLKYGKNVTTNGTVSESMDVHTTPKWKEELFEDLLSSINCSL